MTPTPADPIGTLTIALLPDGTLNIAAQGVPNLLMALGLLETAKYQLLKRGTSEASPIIAGRMA